LTFKRLLRHKLAALGLVIVSLLVAVALFAPYIAPADPLKQDVRSRRLPPGPEHVLGTDELGRDLLSRLIYGTRVSLTVAVGATGAAMLLGVPLGLMAGYYGKVWDLIAMRGIDVLLSFPHILLAIIIVTVLGPGLDKMMLAIGIWTMPTFARLFRASVLAVKQQEFVTASRSLGASDARIIWRHIFPNCLGPLVVTASLNMSTAVLAESGLSFLGLGIQPPTPSWGVILAAGQSIIRSAPHVVTFPGLAILVTALAFNFLGDGLRDVLDPRQRR
jgi:peptide/nickel transport system permease protein